MEDKQKTTQQPTRKEQADPRAKEAAGKPTDPVKESALREAVQINGLEQLREILFGAIQRDLERRVARADAHVTARANELEEETRRRSEMLEGHLRKETEALAVRLEREFVGTSDSIRAMGRDQRESITALEQRIVKLEESIGRSERELRHQILEQTKSFFDELHRLRSEFTEMIERELRLAEGTIGEYEERPAPP
jgi:hypothetical protein